MSFNLEKELMELFKEVYKPNAFEGSLNIQNEHSYGTKPIELAEQALKKYDLIFYGGQLWYYNNGCYKPADMELRNYFQSKLGNDFSSHKVREIFYILESRVHKEDIYSDTNNNFISFKNGVYKSYNQKLCLGG